MSLSLCLTLALLGQTPPTTIPVNLEWDVLSEPGEDLRPSFAQAGKALGDWKIDLAGSLVDGPMLIALSKTPDEEPFLRAVREKMRRPVDPQDLLWFVDDILLAGKKSGLRGQPVVLTPSRARGTGVFIHPKEVFRKQVRTYPEKGDLAIDPPEEQSSLQPAVDDEVLGPRWTRRFEQPDDEPGLMKLLETRNPSFAKRARELMSQLAAQGATVVVESTVRKPERGFLLYGSFIVGRAKSEKQLNAVIAKLERLEKEWKLDIPITWRHPDGWKATVEAGRKMADTYNVVYATEKGAKSSNHYDAVAIDLVAFGLPRTLRLKAPNGKKRTFDLSAPEQTRDLSLTPELIRWVERNFGFRKHRTDYPHWNDRPPRNDRKR